QKDPTLFPESRVRPWVVDKEAERKMEDMFDNLEKTLSFVSPVKDGLGVSTLDRTLGSDNSGELFFRELASLEAKKRAKDEGVSARTCGIKNIREVFEDLYRENHGLPPRKGKEGLIGENHRRAETESAVATSAAESERESEPGAGGESVEGEEDELAADPDVARLLAELQVEFDGDCSDGKRAGKENPPSLQPAMKKEQQHLQQNSSGSRPTMGTREGGPAVPPRDDEQDHLVRQEEGGRIDISRIKIDGPRQRTRPRSAPSACLSAGGFSRVSSRTCSSSRLARTVSQKLLQATKEAEEQRAALSEGQAAMPPRPCTPASAIARADGRINVVKRNAETLQASMSVKRTSYLNARQPRAARWSPRDPDLCPGRTQRRSSPRRVPCSVRPALGTVRPRPKTAVPTSRQRGSLEQPRFFGHGGSNKGNGKPLLSRREAEFLFGEKAGTCTTAVGEDDASCQTPSLRATTLGRMLRRSSVSSFATSDGAGDSRNHARSSLSGCSSASSLYRRPLSADDGGRRNGHPREGSGRARRRGERGSGVRFEGCCSSKPRSRRKACSRGKAAGPATAVAWAKRGPRSAAPDSCRRGGERPSSSGEHPARHGNENPAAWNREGSGQKNMAKKSAARWCGDGVGEVAMVDGYGEQLELPAEAREGTSAPSAMNARQALEATIKAAIDVVPPLEQFVSARKTIADMKRINTKDSTGETLVTTQGMSKARVAEECWTSEAEREYR
ncbi:unnamed protein product, partial [Scytosiphon promiscuus]